MAGHMVRSRSQAVSCCRYLAEDFNSWPSLICWTFSRRAPLAMHTTSSIRDLQPRKGMPFPAFVITFPNMIKLLVTAMLKLRAPPRWTRRHLRTRQAFRTFAHKKRIFQAPSWLLFYFDLLASVAGVQSYTARTHTTTRYCR